jgi:hypothetical protein
MDENSECGSEGMWFDPHTGLHRKNEGLLMCICHRAINISMFTISVVDLSVHLWAILELLNFVITCMSQCRLCHYFLEKKKHWFPIP